MEANRKRVKIHRLPTEDKSQIWGWRLGLAFMKTPSKPVKGAEGLPYHLYFTTDEEPFEGDWMYNTQTKEIFQLPNPVREGFIARKIIATTDPKLTVHFEGHEYGTAREINAEVYLPQPSQDFIKAYCEQGGIDKVDVEYWIVEKEYSITKKREIEIKVDPIHNTITTHRIVEKMYNKQDLLELTMGNSNIIDWIEENL